jgi:hypothetical protein
LDFEETRVLHVTRDNKDGRYEVQLQHNGYDRPCIFKKDITLRKLQVRCETRTEGDSEHILRFVFKDKASQTLNDERVRVRKNADDSNWQKIDLRFQLSATADWYFRIDDEVTSENPGSIKIRDLIITERVS